MILWSWFRAKLQRGRPDSEWSPKKKDSKTTVDFFLNNRLFLEMLTKYIIAHVFV